MKWLERYVDAVKTYLPNNLKQDVSDELLADLQDECDDKAEQQGRPVNEEEVHQILLRRGHPITVAASYHPRKTLVSEELFPFYTQVLKWVLLVLFIAQCIGQMANMFDSQPMHFASAAWSIIGGTWDAGIHAFAWVTLTFYVIGESISRKQLFSNWHPKQLPNETASGAQINYFDSGVELFFQILFIAYINQLLQMPNIQLAALTVDFSQQLQAIVPWINGVMLLSIGYTLLKLVYPFWSRRKIIIEWLIYVPSIAILVALYRIDSHFAVELIMEGNERRYPLPENWWQNFLIVIGGIFIIDIVVKIRRFMQLGKAY